MKNLLKFLCLVFILGVMVSSICFGYSGSTMSISKACKDLSQDKGKDCYIIGKFVMIHTEDISIAQPEIANGASDLASLSTFSIRIELLNTNNNKTSAFFLKPVTGSSTYYKNEKQLAENAEDPYWVLKVPAGTYAITNFICSLTVKQPGYQDFREPVIEVPVSKVINRPVNFTTQPKQIIYIGDYDTILTTYICLYQVTQIYTFRNLKIDLKDNFETAKTSFINGADDKTKEKLNDYDFVSALQ
jgi:hypothetical protein